MLYNNQSPYTICLLVPNREALKRYLHHKHLSPESPEGQQTALHKLEKELLAYRGHGHFKDMFPQRWLPSATGILSEGFTEENHMLNSTMKMVRGKIVERYLKRIDLLYTPDGRDFHNKENQAVIKELLGSK